MIAPTTSWSYNSILSSFSAFFDARGAGRRGGPIGGFKRYGSIHQDSAILTLQSKFNFWSCPIILPAREFVLSVRAFKDFSVPAIFAFPYICFS